MTFQIIDNFDGWLAAYPEAGAALAKLSTEVQDVEGVQGGESAAQQNVEFEVARAGGLIWRNNVGATPAKTYHTCPHCSFHYKELHDPIRYGLANKSPGMNARFKSADLIGVMPRLIVPEDVGRTIGQFIAREVKRPGWTYTGAGRETPQRAWLELANSKGADAKFTTGAANL